MSTAEGTVRFERVGTVAIITLDRPQKLNAYSPEMYELLIQAFAQFKDDKDLRAAILTGTGDRAFCAGADLSKTITKLTDGGERHAAKDITKRFFSDIYKPIITAVNGICTAGGLEMMQGTDLRLAVPNATFGLGEVRWGITPGGGSHVRLPRQIPWAVAMEILLTGQPISAQRAYEVGLINRVVEPEDLMDEALKLAEIIGRNGPLAVKAAKEIAVRAMALESPFELEYYISNEVLRTEDAKEGPRAFAEKRAPDYKGR
ncbi:enoyl-CoA hydratase/isomerase family protein [Rhodococcus sp. MS16]|uniref:enoyl-CoA hydratase/isomerase family protein n=1 Tax=Rhodococcus TaxID=1827 RepID=UPI0015620914|nr:MULTISPECIES: enoyl-CoA hydratase-related protein [Rhodococcus]MCE4267542.1 enoyl-CoA hydratase/isomerase family protein [Rhodococcus globerulus]NRI68722.1 enoyl-CoA hydratase/isomerase family protein [Rhodococcus sp. MS16]